MASNQKEIKIRTTLHKPFIFSQLFLFPQISLYYNIPAYDHYNPPAPASKPTTDGEEGVSPPPCSLGGSAAAGEFSHTADSTSYSSSQGSFSLDSSSPKGASEESKPAKTLFKDNYADGFDNSEAASPQKKPPKPKIITLSSESEESDKLTKETSLKVSLSKSTQKAIARFMEPLLLLQSP